MDGKELALKVAKENGALYIEQCPDWNGRECWFMYFYEPGEKVPCIGVPLYILIDNGECSITDYDQTHEYIHYLEEKYGFDENGDILGVEKPAIIKVK